MLKKFILVWAFLMTACSTGPTISNKPNEFDLPDLSDPKRTFTNTYGESIVDIGDDVETESVFGPNRYLWQSAIITMSFMGIDTLVPEQGIVITNDYKNSPQGSMYQATIVVSGSELFSNNLSVSVVEKREDGTSSSNDKVASGLKDAILLKARELRLNK